MGALLTERRPKMAGAAGSGPRIVYTVDTSLLAEQRARAPRDEELAQWVIWE